MPRMRLLLAIALLSTLLAPLRADARPSLELAGRNLIVGDEIGMTRVHIFRSVTLSGDVFENPDLQIESSGLFSGLILKQDVPRGGVEVMALRVPLCASTKCREHAITFVELIDPDARHHSRRFELPAGDYFLYLITDGAPVGITLKLNGLSGVAHIIPVGLADAGYNELDPYVGATAPGRSIAASQTDHPLEHMGISVVGMWLDADKHHSTEIDTCALRRLGPVDFPRPHGILCFGEGRVWSASYETQQISPTKLLAVNYEFLGAGDWTRVLNYRSESEVRSAAAFDFRISYPRGKRRGGVSGFLMGSGD